MRGSSLTRRRCACYVRPRGVVRLRSGGRRVGSGRGVV